MKSEEYLATAVVTTTSILESTSPIVYAHHLHDGTWKFMGSEECIRLEDLYVVFIRDILEIDASVGLLSEMPTGFEAMRKSPKYRWKVVCVN